MQRKKALSSFIHLRVGILSVLISFCMTAAFAQQSTVKGKVLDETGQPIIGANVSILNTSNGTITDIDGAFLLT